MKTLYPSVQTLALIPPADTDYILAFTSIVNNQTHCEYISRTVLLSEFITYPEVKNWVYLKPVPGEMFHIHDENSYHIDIYIIRV